MEPATETHDRPINLLFHFFQSATSSFTSLLSPPSIKKLPAPLLKLPSKPPSKVCFPLFDSDTGPCPCLSDSDQKNDVSSLSPPFILEDSSGDDSGELTPAVRMTVPNSGVNNGGPAFIGQVYSMCDLSGTGLMAVSTHFNIPFLSKRTPGWLKKMFATITKSERTGPVFHFFMDLGDAVAHVTRLNIPSGVVGACRLDLAYEHFKEKSDLFQFVPNERQVKAAKELLKAIPEDGGRKRIDGVPVFSAQNLEIAIAATNGIKWYTPYFFDKKMLDKILEESVDQHFHSLIQSRHTQRWEGLFDDSMGAEAMNENAESGLWEPPEAEEVMEEMGDPGIPLSVLSKAAEMQFLHGVDNLLLGNRWLRKATGIQPRFPYMVDSFERRSLASSARASESSIIEEEEEEEEVEWDGRSKEQNVFLPKITMIGISSSEREMSKGSLKKTVEDLTKELDGEDKRRWEFVKSGYRDPLFVADVGDSFSSGLGNPGSSGRWVRGRNT